MLLFKHMGVGRIFSRGEIVDFSRGSHKIFPGEGQKWWNLIFSLSKLRKWPFFAKNLTEKCQISKSREGPRPLLSHPFRRPCSHSINQRVLPFSAVTVSPTMSEVNIHMRKNALIVTWSESLKICCHLIVTQPTETVEQCAGKFRNVSQQAKEWKWAGAHTRDLTFLWW